MWRAVLLLALAPSIAVAQPRAVERVSRALAAALAREHPEEVQSRRVSTREDAVAFGTVVTASFDPPLYPGTGVARVIVGADGRSYGRRGEADFAELVRALGWLRAPPSAAAFMEALNAAEFDGMTAHRVPPSIALAGGVLRFTFRRASPLRGDEIETIAVEVRTNGPMTMTRTPIVAEEAPALAPRELVRRAALGQSVETMALVSALAALRGGAVDTQLRAWLVTLSTNQTANYMIATDAIGALDASPASATALRARWRGLSAEHRDLLLGFATGAHGPAFRARIERP